MRKLTTTIWLTLCTCLFATSAVAEEIVMICTDYEDGKTLTRYHKYSNPMIGRKQIYQRENGKWLNWCIPRSDYSKPCEFSISDKGAVKTAYFNHEIDNESWSKKHGYPMGTPILQIYRHYLDFEFVTSKVEAQSYFLSGEKLPEDDGKTWIWNCKLKDASSPSIKGRIEGVIR